MVMIGFVGDIMLSREVGNRIMEGKLNFLENIEDLLSEVDILCGNLESPISDNPERIGVFSAPTKSKEIIKNFHILNLANNHIYDGGLKGIEDTLKILRENNIKYVGIGESIEEAYSPSIIEKDNLTFAFLGCISSDLFFSMRKYNITKYYISVLDGNFERTVENLKGKVDFIIILVHGGNEFVSLPPPSLKDKLELLISKGANLIITHHPHIIGGYRVFRLDKNLKLIWYSLGDFIFDSKINSRKMTGMLLVDISNSGIEDFKFLPMYINKEYKLEKANDILSKMIIDKINKNSLIIGNEKYTKLHNSLYMKEFIRFQIEKLYTIYKEYGIFAFLNYVIRSIKYFIYYVKKIIRGGYK